MQEIRKALCRKYDRAFRAMPGVFRVEYSDGPEASFFVTFHYRTKSGHAKVFRKYYDRCYVFGSSCTRPNPADWEMRMRLCRFGQEAVEELLADMGVL